MRVDNFTQLYNLIKGKNISPAFEKSVTDYNGLCNCLKSRKEQARIQVNANYLVTINYISQNRPLAFSLMGGDNVLEFFNDGRQISLIVR